MQSTAEQHAGAAIYGENEISKFLTFMLGNEEYGLEIMKVREIIGMMAITHVPKMPEFVRGVINLRGKVIPVVNLRLKFGMDTLDDTAETCIIVVDLGELLMGIVVDRVLEVLNITGAEVDAAPSFGVSVDTEFILGIGKTKGRVVMLLDIDRVLTAQDINALSTTAKQG